MTNRQTPFVVDIDPGFRNLRSDIRDDMRTAEDALRAAMEEWLRKLHIEVSEDLHCVTVETPAEFVRAMLPFFVSLSEMRDMYDASRSIPREPHISIN